MDAWMDGEGLPQCPFGKVCVTCVCLRSHGILGACGAAGSGSSVRKIWARVAQRTLILQQ